MKEKLKGIMEEKKMNKAINFIIINKTFEYDFTYTKRFYYEDEDEGKGYLVMADKKKNSSLIYRCRLFLLDYMGEPKELLHETELLNNKN